MLGGKYGGVLCVRGWKEGPQKDRRPRRSAWLAGQQQQKLRWRSAKAESAALGISRYPLLPDNSWTQIGSCDKNPIVKPVICGLWTPGGPGEKFGFLLTPVLPLPSSSSTRTSTSAWSTRAVTNCSAVLWHPAKWSSRLVAQFSYKKCQLSLKESSWNIIAPYHWQQSSQLYMAP